MTLKKGKKMVGIIIVVLLVIIGVMILLSGVSYLIVNGAIKSKQKNLEVIYSRANFTPEELQSDINWYKGMLERVHPAEIPEFPLGNVEKQIDNLSSSITGSMTRIDFFKKIAPIVSDINDEHTTIFLPDYELEKYRNGGGKFLPLDVSFIEGRLYIKTNLSGNNDILPGMEILSINGVSSSTLKNTLKLFFSGSTNDQKIFYLQEHFANALYIGYGAADSFSLELQKSGSKEIKTFVVQGQIAENKKLEPFYYEIVDNNTMVFTYNLFKDSGNTFKVFLNDMFRTIQEKSIKNLVIDLRKNKGGDTYFGDMILSYLTETPFYQYSRIDVLVSKEARKAFISEAPGFIRWFPIQYIHPMLKPLWGKAPGNIVSMSMEERIPQKSEFQFSGDLFVIIGSGSMSSATMLPSTIKKYNLGTLVGEETGGKDTMYGNVTNYRLPNTGLEIEMPCGVVYGNTIGRVEPDYKVKQSVSDLEAEKDTVLEYIEELCL